jgi:hypothetical protein
MPPNHAAKAISPRSARLLDAIGLSRERDALTIVEAAAKSLPAPQLIVTGLLTGLILARRVDLSRRHRRLGD